MELRNTRILSQIYVMLRYLSILTLLAIFACATKQSEPLSAESPTSDTSAVLIKNKHVDADPESSADNWRAPKLTRDKERPFKHILSLYQSLQALHGEDTFEAKIKPDKDTLLNLPQGTRLLIPANAFRAGLKNAAAVVIRVQEYYSLSDVISENLTTTTEDDVLETGGMIHITAMSNGEECILNDGKEIQICFPVADYKPGMQLFNGTRDTRNRIVWTPSSPIIETELEKSDGIFISPEQMPEFPGGFQALKKHISKNLKYPAAARRLCIEGVVYVQFVVDRSGYVTNPIVLRGIHKLVDNAALEAIAVMPRWKPGRMDGKAVDVRMVYPVRFSLDGSGLSMSSNTGNPYEDEQIRDFEKNMTDAALKKSDADEVSYYILKTAKLGWINCDRFIEAKERVTLKVHVPGDPEENVDVKLIFHKIRSILPAQRAGNFFYFSNIPKNEQAEILALHVGNNGLEMTNKKIIAGSTHTDSLLSFQPVTVAKLKDYLKEFDAK